MALITRCPVCGTRFKVVPDQLRISDGWVRCGECAEVFDASMDLTQSEAEPVLARTSGDVGPSGGLQSVDAPAPPEEPPIGGTGFGTGYVWSVPPPPEPVVQPRFDAPFQPPLAKPSLPSVAPQVSVDDRPVPGIEGATPVDDPGPALAPWDPTLDDPVDEVPEKPEPTALGDGDEEVSQSLTEFPADMSTLPEESAYIAPPAAAEVDAALEEPRPVSFLKVQSAPERDVWQRPWVRRSLAAMAGLLVLTLGVQAAVQQRDQIAARLPGATPLLRGLCVPLGCTVQALRQIDAIVIDSSTFTTVRHGVYRLNLVLKNRAATEIALPAIELALTDTQEQPVLRRVLQAADMVPVSGSLAADTIPPNAEWTASMELAVVDEPSVARIVGYRLLAFYP
ncbi:hypothetical protein RD110_22995 [Rhodoferax koreense]|uniref:Zinc finger/thioredoxin putative domain-containing protein n=1 Tax=Rhodoferax koreensis TaxID=1842727 RepID=A0A1P8K126_9BURK|nr:zinc-ribbon and DUF3426 domain-containing protein [Rhodoferax koreense]APW39713.1 hypothetical protein RD110_22995 [Rhodoferax koreense]